MSGADVEAQWFTPRLRLVGTDEQIVSRAKHGPVTVRIEGNPSDVAEFLLQLAGRGGKVDAGNNVTSSESPSVGAERESGRAVVTTIDQALAGWRDQLTANGCAPSTIATYRRQINHTAAAMGWTTVDHITHASAVAFLANRARGDHGGKAWGPSIRRVAVAALVGFTDYLRMTGAVQADPLADLRAPKRHDGPGKHAFTADEARAFLAASVARHGRDRRQTGASPLIWYLMFSTGLRHEEVGHLRWTDLTLEGDLPGIRCRTWPGNKAKRADWIPLRPRLAALLIEHRRRSGSDLVFPLVATKETWAKDRAGAGLPAVDADGQLLSPHSTRASFITWLGQCAAIPEGLRQRLARHKSLTETTYTTRTRAEMADAIAQLPEIWPSSPETEPPPWRNKRGDDSHNSPDLGEPAETPGKRLASGRETGDIGAGSHDLSPHQTLHTPGARSWLPPQSASAVQLDGGPAGELEGQRPHSSRETPVSSDDVRTRAVIELLGISKTLRSYLASRQPPSGS